MQTLAQEFETLRQMTRLCIGRQGNHFPLLSREYFHGGIKDIATRENVVRALAADRVDRLRGLLQALQERPQQDSPLRPPRPLLRRFGRVLGTLR